MTYKTDAGEVIEGASPLELVTALQSGGRFTSDETTEQFMAGFAFRSREYNAQDIDPTTPELFINDLIRTGYLTPVQ